MLDPNECNHFIPASLLAASPIFRPTWLEISQRVTDRAHGSTARAARPTVFRSLPPWATRPTLVTSSGSRWLPSPFFISSTLFFPEEGPEAEMRAALRLAERDHVSCSATIQVLSLFVSDGYGLASQSAQNLEQLAVPHPSQEAT